MGFLDNGQTQKRPFGFDIYDPAAAAGSMRPEPWRANPLESGRTRYATTPFSAPTQQEGQIPEQTIDELGVFNVDLIGGLTPGAPQPSVEEMAQQAAKTPEFRLVPELAKSFGRWAYTLPGTGLALGWTEEDPMAEHVGNFFGLFGNAIDALASTLGVAVGGVELPWHEPGGTLFKEAELIGIEDDPKLIELRAKMERDPAFASRYVNEFIEEEKYWLASKGAASGMMSPQRSTAALYKTLGEEPPGGFKPTDPLDVRAQLWDAPRIQDIIYKGILPFFDIGSKTTRIFTETGIRDTGDIVSPNLSPEQIEALPQQLKDIRERYLAGELKLQDLPTEVAEQGFGWSNDPRVSMVLDIITDPANLIMGAGLAKSVVVNGAKRGLAATAVFRYSKEFGEEASKKVAEDAGRLAVTKAAEAGKAGNANAIKRFADDVTTRAEAIEQANPEWYANIVKEQPAATRALIKLEPVLQKAFDVARIAVEPTELFFNRGAGVSRIAAFSSASATEGAVWSYGPTVVQGLRSLFENTLDNGDDIFGTLLGRIGANVEQGVHAESMVQGAKVGGQMPTGLEGLNPNAVSRSMSESRSNRLTMQAEAFVDRIKTAFVSGGKRGVEANQEALEGARRGARERLISILGKDSDTVSAIDRFLDTANPATRKNENLYALVEHVYYMDLVERFAKAVADDLTRVDDDIAKQQAKLGSAKKTASGQPGKTAKKAQRAIDRINSLRKDVERYTLIGPRELTHERAQKVLSIINSTAMSDEAKAAAVRAAVDDYDILYSTFGARGLSDQDLLIDMKIQLEDLISANSLVKQIVNEGKLPRAVRDVLREEKAFARKAGHDNYAVGLRPEADQLWRATYDPKDGRLIGMNPWLEPITESAKDYNPGRFKIARQRLTRPVRGQKMVEEAKRQFRVSAVDAGLSRAESERLFSTIRAESSRRGLMPRALKQEELWRIAQGINIDQATLNRLGERGLARLVTKAFEGQWATVGIANKISGKMKGFELIPGEVGGVNIPILGGQPAPFIRYVSETLYPNVRFRYNPIFQTQELLEPFFWNILRGVKPGWTWTAKDLESLESMRRAGLISEFEDQYEYSTAILLGAEAVRENFGQSTRIGRLWGSTISEGRRVASVAELKRLNYVRQTAQLNGNYLKQALDGIDSSLWDTMVGEVGTHRWGPKVFGVRRIDNTRVANHYWLNKGLYTPDDPGVQAHLMDIHKPADVGKKPPIRVSRLAVDHGYADEKGFRKAIKDGEYTEQQFNDRMGEFGADADYTQRAWRTASGMSAGEFYHSMKMALRQAGAMSTRDADQAAEAARAIVRRMSKLKSMSEEEFLNDALDGPVQYLNSVSLLPKGARRQLVEEGGLPNHPVAFGQPLLPDTDPRIVRLTAPLKAEQQAVREIQGPIPADPLNGAPPNHPDVQDVVPPPRKRIDGADGRPHHTVGDKSLDDWKEDAAMELGDDGTVRAAQEAVYIPSLMLRLAQNLPDSTLASLFPDLKVTETFTREFVEEEAAQRLLRAFSRRMVKEDMDLSAGVGVLLSLADSASARGAIEDFVGTRELWDLLTVGDDVGLAESWRVSNMMRAMLDGDVVPTSNHQLRSFGYVDEVGLDDIDRGMRVPARKRTAKGAAERTGVLPYSGKDINDPMDELAIDMERWFQDDPADFIENVMADIADGTLDPVARGNVAMALGITDLTGIPDDELLRMLLNRAEVISSEMRLWSGARGYRRRLIESPELVPARVRNEQYMEYNLKQHPEWRKPSVMGEEQWRYMTRKYTQWANELNAEEYLGKTDWTAAQVAAVDNSRYTQFTRSGAAWDINSSTRAHSAVISLDSMPDPATPHRRLFPFLDEVIPDELGGVGLIEDRMGKWWAEGLEDVSGVKVQSVTTAPEPRSLKRTTRYDEDTPDEDLFNAGIDRSEFSYQSYVEVVEDVPMSTGHRTSFVVTGTPEQILRAMRATGAVLQKDSVAAVSLDLIDRRVVDAQSIGVETAMSMTKMPSRGGIWRREFAVDYIVPRADTALYERTFDRLTEMLDDHWKEHDFGRMVYKTDDGDYAIRLIHTNEGDNVYHDRVLESLAELEKEGVRFEMGDVNQIEETIGEGGRYSQEIETKLTPGEEMSDDLEAQRRWNIEGSQDPWVQRLRGAEHTDAELKVLDRYRGEATTQADFLWRQHAPRSYEAKRAVAGDAPAPLRGWRFSHGKKGTRGAINWNADGRASFYLLKNADATTVVHELFHVFARDLDPSLTKHMLEVYAKANSLKRVPKTMSVTAEDWLAEQFVRYMKTGTAPDPATQGGFNSFAKLMKGLIDDGDLVNEELSPMLDTMMGRKGTRDAMFVMDEHRIWNAARSAMQAAEDEAFTTHYFKRGRNLLERSINHPFLGVYPASYMWGKALPELIRFLVAKPFGVDAPLWGTFQAVNVWEGINTQLNSDPEMREYLDENFKETVRFLQMLLPGSPVELPARFPSWATYPFKEYMRNQNRLAKGEEAKPITPMDVTSNLARSAAGTMNPFRWMDTASEITEEVGDYLGSEEEAAPAQQFPL